MGEGIRATNIALLHEECTRAQVSIDVMDAIIHVESSWNPWVVRYERQFAYLLTPEAFAKSSRITLETEAVLQRCSFGLCQVMGGTARDLGFTDILTRLLDPEVNIALGVKLFARLASDYEKVDDQIAAYNAGSVKRADGGAYRNQDYVDKVRMVLDAL